MTAEKKMKHKRHPLKTFWDVIAWSLIIAVVLTAIMLAGVRVIGLQPFAILSESMEPTYMAGSLLYVKKVDYKELKEGDPITFMSDENTVVTHRIISVIPDFNNPDIIRYRTKGDRNDYEDSNMLHCRNIIGKPAYSIPKLGYVVNYIQRPPGKYIAIAGCVLLMSLVFLLLLFRYRDRKSEKNNKNIYSKGKYGYD